jgi:transcriptional regulator with XRE-family HTH domain
VSDQLLEQCRLAAVTANVAGVEQADAGVDRSYVGRIERGVENPTVETLDKLAAALEILVAELLAVPKAGDKAAWDALKRAEETMSH